jgi:hypothetical protein
VQLEKGRGPAEREKENQRQGVGGRLLPKMEKRVMVLGFFCLGFFCIFF